MVKLIQVTCGILHASTPNDERACFLMRLDFFSEATLLAGAALGSPALTLDCGSARFGRTLRMCCLCMGAMPRAARASGVSVVVSVSNQTSSISA